MRLHKFLTSSSPNATRFWLCLSLTFTAIYGYLGLKEAFSSEYVVQDDARQHVVWMLRYLDPDLFPNDLITDYFQSVAPAGYASFYRLIMLTGINPLLLNKLLPPLLGLVTTAYFFGICLEIFPLPATAFISSLVFNQNIWLKDDLISATPRAFAYPILLGFFYYLLRGSLLPTLAAIALLGLFYPQCVFICAGVLVLRLFVWKDGKLQLSSNRENYIFCAAGLTVAFFILLPFALSSSEFGPAITVAEAKSLPEFWPKGRSSFFKSDLWDFYFFGARSGMFPRSLFTPVTLCFGLALPILFAFPRRFPLVQQITAKIAILPQIFIASTVMFIAAHAVLFKLHLPSRYTGHTFRIIIAIATGIALTLLFDTLWRWVKPHLIYRQLIAVALTAIVSVTLIFYPSFVKSFPKTSYRVGVVPALYDFFRQQPKDIMIASVADEVNNIPAFSQRSILVGKEYAIPYQVGYYHQFRQRLLDLVRAQYSPNLAEVKQFIEQYKVDYILLEPGALAPGYINSQRWIRELQPAEEAQTFIQQGTTPALAAMLHLCAEFETQGMVVLSSKCIVQY